MAGGWIWPDDLERYADEVDPRSSEVGLPAPGKRKAGKRAAKDTGGPGRDVLGLQRLGSIFALHRSLSDAGNESLFVRGVAIVAGKENSDTADQRQRAVDDLVKRHAARQRPNAAALRLWHQSRLNAVGFRRGNVTLRQHRCRDIEAIG